MTKVMLAKVSRKMNDDKKPSGEILWAFYFLYFFGEQTFARSIWVTKNDRADITCHQYIGHGSL
jgi:hypothetical protein